MFGSIYKELRQDFEFLNKYKFYYSYDEHHFVMPSVVFSNGKERIQIGMHYEDKKMFALLYHAKEDLQGVNLLDQIQLIGSNYHKQKEQVRKYLDLYFRTKYIHKSM